ncbi:hypothetical protein EDD18DRAFT_1350658 [Armillaria luteobubalina]|uniref:Uncharacterized protein n=1 Tax=Armillaria luteobubalina TaxID=153913 RepID=A0AA39QAD2_9AGAR|nr:hypothetical protein EDD18DRAFT_1350658 [Armillaria luteobubalina]
MSPTRQTPITVSNVLSKVVIEQCVHTSSSARCSCRIDQMHRRRAGVAWIHPAEGHTPLVDHPGHDDEYLALSSVATEKWIPRAQLLLENLQQYMREWEVEGPNCFCPLMDPTSSQVQAILRRDDGDGQWSFVCASEYCEYRIDLTRVFGPGLPQSALQNYAIGAPQTENLDYRTYKERWEEKHRRRWPLLQTGLSNIEEGIEPDTTSVRAPGTVVPESDQEEGPNSPPVPRLDLTKRVPTSPTRNRRIVNPVTTRSKLGSTAKERRLSLQAQGAGGDSVQTEGGDLTKAPTGFRETTLFWETIPVLQQRDLWIHLTQTAVGVTLEELAGLLVKCGGCSKYYRDGLNHYCVE